eukprot:2739094-Prymnesium_polylepis.1
MPPTASATMGAQATNISIVNSALIAPTAAGAAADPPRRCRPSASTTTHRLCNGSYPGTSVALLFLGLGGEVPSELGLLTQLTALSMHSNSLSGEAPSELGLLTQLTYLSMTSNSLSGEVPSELGLLTRLTELY